MNKISIRKYRSEDCIDMAKMFYDTVHTVNMADYSIEQLNAWATGKVDIDKWDKSFLEDYSLVVENNNNEIVGFGDIDSTGYLDRLYVHKDYQKCGIGTMICNELEKWVMNEKIDVIITHASITAKGYFEHRGYNVIKKQKVIRCGVELVNYIMRKNLNYCNK